MRLLLDTHTLLWWLDDDRRLTDEARIAIADPESLIFVSAASTWEIAIKRAQGRLDAPPAFEDVLAFYRFQQLPITHRHALAAGALPRHHNDPFDRMLIAQAAAEQLTIVTRDPRFTPYGIPTLPA